MEKKTKVSVVGWVIVLLLMAAALGYYAYEKLIPSNEVMSLTDYYKLKDNQVIVVLQNKLCETKGILVDGKAYVDYNTVAQEFNKRFYWDANEKLLTYTTPTEIIRAGADSNTYTVTQSLDTTEANAEYPIVKVDGEQVYIAIDFVQQYSNIKSQFYEKPNRLVVTYRWDEDLLSTQTKKATQIRKESDIKSPILQQLPAGTSLLYVDTDEAPVNGFSMVATEDGIVGYVKDSHMKKGEYKTLTNPDYKAPEYTSLLKDKKINLTFHQMFNKSAANYLEGLIAATKNVNVVSPTFFRVKDTTGAMESIATKTYVKKANTLGLEVWGLVNDVDIAVDMYELMSRTSSRETLANNLVKYAIYYKLNGINIDFEQITSDAGEHYVQFLRELSVKCRNNGIILSVDSYVPSAYTSYYDREEQGRIADYVVIMAYDEYNGSSEEAGPVASLGFVQEAVTNILEQVPKEKVIMAIPFYSRWWKVNSDGSINKTGTYAMSDAAKFAAKNGSTPVWSDDTGCNYAEFDKGGANYRIWLEDEKSLEEKMKVIHDAGVAGVASWKLGLEKPAVWNVITKYNN